MRVFRRRHSLGLVALLALALQAALALAHTHTHVYALSGSDGLAQRAITYGMCRAEAQQPCGPLAPHDDHAKCSLCWSVSLASAAVLDAPPAIPQRQVEIEIRAPAPAVARTQGVSSVHFQARAPPRA